MCLGLSVIFSFNALLLFLRTLKHIDTFLLIFLTILNVWLEDISDNIPFSEIIEAILRYDDMIICELCILKNILQ